MVVVLNHVSFSATKSCVFRVSAFRLLFLVELVEMIHICGYSSLCIQDIHFWMFLFLSTIVLFLQSCYQILIRSMGDLRYLIKFVDITTFWRPGVSGKKLLRQTMSRIPNDVRLICSSPNLDSLWCIILWNDFGKWLIKLMVRKSLQD